MIPIELRTLKRVGGCARRINVLGFLFGEREKEFIVNLRSNTTCFEDMLTTKATNVPPSKCNQDECPNFRVGTAGSVKIVWDNPGATI